MAPNVASDEKQAKKQCVWSLKFTKMTKKIYKKSTFFQKKISHVFENIWCSQTTRSPVTNNFCSNYTHEYIKIGQFTLSSDFDNMFQWKCSLRKFRPLSLFLYTHTKLSHTNMFRNPKKKNPRRGDQCERANTQKIWMLLRLIRYDYICLISHNCPRTVKLLARFWWWWGGG